MKIINSFQYAFRGISEAIATQYNFKIHFTCAIAVIIAAFFFHVATLEWLIILLCIAIVISLEMINTAIEYLVDLISPGQNEIAGKVKDIAAGAVLVSAIISFVIAVLIFAPKCFLILR